MDSIEKISHDITIIVITHKPSTASKADCIFIFDEGRIIESGTYNDLVMSLESKLINTSGKVT
jgi:ABC-type multidrug transport system fused ATPase/permease subunit